MLKNLNFEENAIWKQRFRAPKIRWAKIANLNPQRGLVSADHDGVLQLYAWDVATGDLQQLTNHPAGVVNGLPSADGEYIYYLRDEEGSEMGHYVRIPFSGGQPEDLTPNLPPYHASFLNLLAQSYCGNRLCMRVADADGFKLYAFAPGQEPRQLYKSQRFFSDPVLSYSGEMAVIASTREDSSLDTQLLALDTRSGELLAELGDGEGISYSIGEFAPRPDDFRILTSTSKSGYERPFIWDPKSGVRRELFIDDLIGEVEAWRWSKDAKKVLLSQLNQARRQLYLYDLERDTAVKLKHPAGLVGSYFDNGILTDEDELFITWQNPANPASLIALDGNGKKEPRTILAAGTVPDGRLWKSITYTSENGDPIQGWLAVPDGEGPFPTILHVKGGPASVMFEYYYPESQAWLDHGFAFLSINYHGATTFGKAFEKSIMGQWGELEVQDMAAGYQWLVENGIAQPGAVFLMGDSYGGYLTLQAMGKRPELWAGGMAGMAIADWAMIYEDASDLMREHQRISFGGTPEEKPDVYDKSSPITYAETVQAPILVIQGSNDSRCTPRQMQAYVARLQALGKQIDVHWFEAGHGSQAQEQQLEHQAHRMRFVYEVLQ